MKNKSERFLTKFDRGRLIIAGGDRGQLFSIFISSKAAKLTGCGMVVNVVPSKLITTLETMNPMCKIYAADSILDDKKMNFEAIKDLFRYSKAIILGPGMEWKRKKKQRFTAFCLRQSHLSVIIDGDALDTAKHNELLQKKGRKAKTVIVVANFNECVKLISSKTENRKHGEKNERNKIVRKLCNFARVNSCYVLHKGYGFILFSPDGSIREFRVKSIPQMATAGMGDVLTAFMGGFIAKGLLPPEAVRSAIALRQKAAELYLIENPGCMTILPQNIISYAPMAFRKSRSVFSYKKGK